MLPSVDLPHAEGAAELAVPLLVAYVEKQSSRALRTKIEEPERPIEASD